MLFELRVLSGINIGAAFPLTKTSYVISNDVNADIYIKLGCNEKISLLLDKLKDGWVLNDPVTGREESIPNNKIFKIQDDHYVIKKTTDDWSDKLNSCGGNVISFGFRRPMFIISNIIIFTSFLIFTNQNGKQYDNENLKSNEVILVESQISKTEAAIWLRKTLRDYELHRHIKLVESEDGFIIEGELLHEQIKRKNKAILMYQDKFQKKIYDNTNLREVNTTPFDIKQIVSSNPAHVVTANNDYIFVGDELDGWRLKSVNNINVDFEKIN